MAALKHVRWIVFAGTRSERSNSLLNQLVRGYARGIQRPPVADRTPAEDLRQLKSKGFAKVKDPRLNSFLPFISGDATQTQFRQNEKPDRQATKKHAGTAKQREQNVYSSSRKNQGVLSSDVTKSGLKYEKLQDGDKRFGRVLMAAKSRKEREKCKLILLEGKRLILDSLQAGAQLKYLYFTDTSLLSGLPVDLLEAAQLYKVHYRHLKLWADTQTPAGVLGVFAKPAVGEVLCPQQDSLPLTLICDNIRDPGNLGTLIRTAAAVGCAKVITTKGCVDIWDPKVLRGAMGGHFYTCILNSLPWEEIANHIPPSSYLCIADTRKGSAVEQSFDMAHPKVMELVDAAKVEPGSSGEEADAEDSSSTDEDSSSSSHEENDSPQKSVKDKGSDVFERVPLSVVQYSDMDCTGATETVVIVGGETEGVSSQAKKLAFDLYGQYVTIPMVAAVDSLNTATAAAVVLYEARRQLTVVQQRSRSRRMPGKQRVPVAS